VVTVMAVIGDASPALGQCGQDFHATPVHSDVPGGPPLAVGDSVLADAVPLLVRDGFEADGMVCRQMSQGLALLQARQAHLPHLIVLALGTNGEVTPEQIDSALRIVGPQRILALVTPHGSVVPSTAQVIRTAAASHQGRIVLLDWDRLAEGHPHWFAPDGVHLGGQEGIGAFAQMMASLMPYASPEAPEPSGPEEPTGPPITIQPPPSHRSPAIHHPKATKQSQPATRASAPPASGVGATRPAAAPSPRLPAHPASATLSHSAANKVPVLALSVLGALMLIAAAVVWRLKHR
jgi:hypothetical protein